MAVNSRYLPSGQKNINFGQKQPQQTIWLPFSTILRPYWGLFNASVIHIELKRSSMYQNDRWNMAINSHYLPSGQKAFSFGQKQPPPKKNPT